jgi:hypothetical protein
VAKLTRLTHKIVIQLHLVAKSGTICSSCSRQPIQKLLEFCCHNPLCCFSKSNTKGMHIFHYRLNPETFGYALVDVNGFRELVTDYIAAPISSNMSEWHRQTNSNTTAGVPMLSNTYQSTVWIQLAMIQAVHRQTDRQTDSDNSSLNLLINKPR